MAKHKAPAPRAQRGETLAEVLIALLIVALATLLLATMMATSLGVNVAARQKDAAFYEALSKVEAMDAPPATTAKFDMVIEQTEGPEPHSSQKVEVDGYTSGGLTVYKVNP